MGMGRVCRGVADDVFIYLVYLPRVRALSTCNKYMPVGGTMSLHTSRICLTLRP